MTTISALPPAPDINDPINFSALANTFVAALPPMVTEINTVVSEVNASNSNVNTKSAQVDANTSAVATNTATCVASASSATASATLAQDWATKTSGPVSGSDYSSKYWAQIAQGATLGTLVDDTTSSTSKVYSSSKVESAFAKKTGATFTGDVVCNTENTAQYISTSLVGHNSQQGSRWYSAGHANWNIVQSKIPGNPTEWKIYSNSYQGTATCTAGSNHITRTSGHPFQVDWVGLPYFYFEGSTYTVESVPDENNLYVKNIDGSPVTWGATYSGTWHNVCTTTQSVVNVSGKIVTYVSGQPFLPACDFLFINGVQYQVESVQNEHALTITNPVASMSAVPMRQYVNVEGALSGLRLQGAAGANGEGFMINHQPWGTTLLSFRQGAGKYRPVWIGTGENPAGTFNPLISMYPGGTLGSPGSLFLGGDVGNHAVHVSQNSRNVNHIQLSGGESGARCGFAQRGSNTSGINFDVQGAGDVIFTSGGYSSVNFKVSGTYGGSYLTVNSSNSHNPSVVATGGINPTVVLQGGGTGGVALKDGTTTTRLKVDADYGVRITPLSFAVPPTIGEMTIQATSNTQLTFSYKGSDGVVRAATLTLA